MNKNLIYIVAIDHNTSKIKSSSYSEYCINTWKYWCNKHNVDLVVCTEHDTRFGRPIWNKELIYERGKDYEKIGVVDLDTMIHWDAPNIFEMFDDEFCAVRDIANLKWVYDSVKNYGKFFEHNIDFQKYVNAGVLFFHNKHLHVFEQVLDFYLSNQTELDNWTLGGGKEQTILNYFLQLNNTPQKLLDQEWNLLAMHRNGMFQYNWQLNEDKTPFFLKYGYVWHFTGFGPEQRENLMKQTWEIIKHNYE